MPLGGTCPDPLPPEPNLHTGRRTLNEGGTGRWEREDEPGWGRSSHGHSAEFAFEASFWLSNREGEVRSCPGPGGVLGGGKARSNPLHEGPLFLPIQTLKIGSAHASMTCPLSRAWGGGGRGQWRLPRVASGWRAANDLAVYRRSRAPREACSEKAAPGEGRGAGLVLEAAGASCSGARAP